MTEIADSLRLLYETTLDENEDKYELTLPKELVEGTSLTTESPYRVALLESPTQTGQKSESSGSTHRVTEATDEEQIETPDPPVKVGDVRSVTIDTLGDQGDGLAKVERGFIVIVPGTQPGDRVDVEITKVKDTVAFADPVGKAEVR
ncbi:TRAM domain-containing protein [Halopenitus salinus]|uniref:TRAM domain-containing protein n=1 Tax=Halopenitus salinus TaxID=1198295 RepID=A0ABD5UWS5_9EURY